MPPLALLSIIMPLAIVIAAWLGAWLDHDPQVVNGVVREIPETHIDYKA